MEDAILKLCEGLLEHFCTFGLREDLIVFGYLKHKKDFDNFLDILKVYNSSYSVRSSRGKNKGIESSRIKFCEDSGLPYIPGEVIYYDCIHGEKYFRGKNNLREQNQDQPIPKKPRLKDTRKLGCDSKLNVYIRNVFVDKKYYVPGTRSRTSKTKALDDLKDTMGSTDKPAMETWYFIQLALKHNHPLTGEKMNIHPVLKERIESLVKSGITSVSTIRVLLKEKVNEMIEKKLSLTQPPSSKNSSYYPNDSVIYCHIWKTVLSLKKQGLYKDPLKNKNNDSVENKKVRKKRKTKSTDKDDKKDVIETPLIITDCKSLYEEGVDEATEHWVCVERKTKSTEKVDKKDVIETPLIITECNGIFEEVVVDEGAQHWVCVERKTKSTDKVDKKDVIETPLIITDYNSMYEEVIDEAAEHWVVAVTCTVETENEQTGEFFLREEIV